jgi:uncharacterized damage-inducible protein DinB
MSPLISAYTAYNAWANDRIIQWLRTLDQDLLYREVPSSYRSIDYTLQHVNRSQKYWWLFINGQDTTAFDWSVYEGEVGRIMDEILDYSEKMKTGFSAFSESELAEVLHLRAKWISNQRPRYEYILHIINHGTYHRGQVVTMARVLGVTEGIPNTDFNFFG